MKRQSDVIFLQDTYSSLESIKRWETEWARKIVSSQCSSHSRGVLSRLNRCEKTATANRSVCAVADG